MDQSTVQEAIENQVQEANQVVTYLQGKIPMLADLGIKLLISFIVFLIGRKVIKVLLRLIRKPFVRAGLEDVSIRFIDSLITALLYIVLIAGIAMYLGVQGASIAALLGSMGLGIVLALKESLANLASGFILLAMKPFSSGDYIKEDNKGNEGTVIEITLFYTILATPDNRTVSVPNGLLANTSITNVSKQDKRQMRETVGLSYDADIKQAKQILQKIIESDAAVLQGEPIDIFVDQLAESAVMLGWRCWVSTNEYQTARWRMTEIIKYEFDKAGIEIYKKISITRN